MRPVGVALSTFSSAALEPRNEAHALNAVPLKAERSDGNGRLLSVRQEWKWVFQRDDPCFRMESKVI